MNYAKGELVYLNVNIGHSILSVLTFFGTLIGLDFVWMIYAIQMKTPEQIEAELDPLPYQMALHLMIWFIPFCMFTAGFALVFIPTTMHIRYVAARYWCLTGCLCCLTTVSMIAVYIVAYQYVKFGNAVTFFGFAALAAAMSACLGSLFLRVLQKKAEFVAKQY